MTFISYAQNFEDVMLWRALRHVPQGFWIDVGAAHPDDLSVTRAFSDRGWRGINIEANPTAIDCLRDARPRDVTLAVAVAEQAGSVTFFEVLGTGMSTMDASYASQHRSQGYEVREHVIEARTLASICDEYAPSTIHFLKIDVEGAERDVLAGADWKRHRPWIVLVEATLPNSQVQTHAAWEPLLLAADYRFAWFDGLNRFYIAAERWDELAPAFVTPPNVFDGFVRVIDQDQLAKITAASDGLGEARLLAWRAEERARQAEERVHHAEERLAEACATAARCAEELGQIRASLSWRMTGPMRATRALFGGHVGVALKELGVSHASAVRLRDLTRRAMSRTQKK